MICGIRIVVLMPEKKNSEDENDGAKPNTTRILKTSA